MRCPKCSLSNITFIHFLFPINEQRTNDGRKFISERYLTQKKLTQQNSLDNNQALKVLL